MTTIVTPLSCSRSELNSQRAGGYEGESRSRAAEEKPSATAAPLPARRSPQHGEVIDLVYCHGKSVTKIAEIVGIAEAGPLPGRPLWTALPRRAVYGGANGARLIVVSFFFLGLLLFHFLISMPPHFFEVIGFLITRFP